MAWAQFLNTSLFGRRFGLENLSTNRSGTGLAGRRPDFIVGPEDIRKDVTTETTGTYLKAYGVSLLTTSSLTASTHVFRLDPPIPGVEKTIVIQSTAATVATTVVFKITLSTGGAEVINGSTWSSSFTVLSSSSPVCVKLVGVTTAVWATNATSGAFGSAATTST